MGTSLECLIHDTRMNGVGLEIEVEMVENGDKGIAVVKLYGPNTKKDNVVMITKSKGSESKFVTILAEKIVKPLINSFLGVETKTNPTKKKEMEKTNVYKCPQCDKTSYSYPGLKGHITKMHQVKEEPEKVGNKKPLKEEIHDEANKVVNLLLKEIL